MTERRLSAMPSLVVSATAQQDPQTPRWSVQSRLPRRLNGSARSASAKPPVFEIPLA